MKYIAESQVFSSDDDDNIKNFKFTFKPRFSFLSPKKINKLEKIAIEIGSVPENLVLKSSSNRQHEPLCYFSVPESEMIDGEKCTEITGDMKKRIFGDIGLVLTVGVVLNPKAIQKISLEEGESITIECALRILNDGKSYYSDPQAFIIDGVHLKPQLFALSSDRLEYQTEYSLNMSKHPVAKVNLEHQTHGDMTDNTPFDFWMELRAPEHLESFDEKSIYFCMAGDSANKKYFSGIRCNIDPTADDSYELLVYGDSELLAEPKAFESDRYTVTFKREDKDETGMPQVALISERSDSNTADQTRPFELSVDIGSNKSNTSLHIAIEDKTIVSKLPKVIVEQVLPDTRDMPGQSTLGEAIDWYPEAKSTRSVFKCRLANTGTNANKAISINGMKVAVDIEPDVLAFTSPDIVQSPMQSFIQIVSNTGMQLKSAYSSNKEAVFEPFEVGAENWAKNPECSVALDFKKIQSMCRETCQIKLTIAFDYTIDGNTQQFSHRLNCTLAKTHSDYWLAIDFGTSAITAFWGKSDEEDLHRFILQLQPGKQDSDALEKNTLLLPSLMYLRKKMDDTQAEQSEKNQNIEVDSIPHFKSINNETQLISRHKQVLPFTKSLIGIETIKHNVTDGEKISLDVYEQVIKGFLELFRDKILKVLVTQGSDRRVQISDLFSRIIFSHPNLVSSKYQHVIKQVFTEMPALPLDKNKEITLECVDEDIFFLQESVAVGFSYIFNPGAWDTQSSSPPEFDGVVRFLVYDMGAGTLDLSYIKVEFSANMPKKIELLGHYYLPMGGNRLDYQIYHALQDLMQQKGKIAEEFLKGGDESGMSFKPIIQNAIKQKWNSADAPVIEALEESDQDILARYLKEVDLSDLNEGIGTWKELANSSHINEYMEQVTVGALENIALLSMDAGKVEEGTFSPEMLNLDRVIISGRGSQFPPIRDYFKSTFGDKLVGLNADQEFLKTCVLHGMVKYVNNVLGKEDTKLVHRAMFGILGCIFIAQGFYYFLPIVHPGDDDLTGQGDEFEKPFDFKELCRKFNIKENISNAIEKVTFCITFDPKLAREVNGVSKGVFDKGLFVYDELTDISSTRARKDGWQFPPKGRVSVSKKSGAVQIMLAHQSGDIAATPFESGNMNVNQTKSLLMEKNTWPYSDNFKPVTSD